MSFLLRVVLPDRPGMLGAVATAIGRAGGDIVSLDVVERGPGGAVDDLLVVVPPGALADTLLTSAESVPGVVVESIRPHHGATDLRGDLELVDALAGGGGLPLLAQRLPGVFRAGWALLLEGDAEGVRVVGSGGGAPDPAGLRLPWLPLAAAQVLDPEAPWVPERWAAAGHGAARGAGRAPRPGGAAGQARWPAASALRAAAPGAPDGDRRVRHRLTQGQAGQRGAAPLTGRSRSQGVSSSAGSAGDRNHPCATSQPIAASRW